VTPTPQLSVGEAATASGPSVGVYDRPDGAIKSTMSNPTSVGAPLTYLVLSTKPGWLKVALPIRPNGSTGWIKRDAVSLSNLVYRLQVSTKANSLALYRGSTLVKTYSAATGTGGTPTPHGSFYLVELLAPTNAGYGPYAFGLSGYSNVLSSFGGGPGQIGLHGTDDPSSIGHAASHGCIRLSNPAITQLAKLLPLGTPIVIQ
jgi:lipoprotein-anchoring transpeptidase ErfK/SrfK